MLKLQRIYQPKNPLFWLMIALNVLSFALAWIVQNRALNTTGMVLVGGFALVNAALGTWLLWRLLASPVETVEPLQSQANPPRHDSAVG